MRKWQYLSNTYTCIHTSIHIVSRAISSINNMRYLDFICESTTAKAHGSQKKGPMSNTIKIIFFKPLYKIQTVTDSVLSTDSNQYCLVYIMLLTVVFTLKYHCPLHIGLDQIHKYLQRDFTNQLFSFCNVESKAHP